MCVCVRLLGNPGIISFTCDSVTNISVFTYNLLILSHRSRLLSLLLKSVIDVSDKDSFRMWHVRLSIYILIILNIQVTDFIKQAKK